MTSAENVFQQTAESNKKARFLGGPLRIRTLLWILPTPAAPWICRHNGVIDDLPMGAHKYARRPTLPFAHRFGFGESQHCEL
jgi:hypothetical protein